MKNNIYREDEECMNFSNEQIMKYIIEKVCEEDNIDIILKSDDDMIIDATSNEKICTIIFDGIKENFFINFYGGQTSLFFNDEEIMFIDDNIKDLYTSSDTKGNIVYEGELRNKTHEKILKLFVDIIIILLGYENVSIEYMHIPEKNKKWYVYYENIITIYGKEEGKGTYVFENLTFKVV